MESDIRAKAPAGLPGASAFPAAPGPFPEIPAGEAEAPVSGVHTVSGVHMGARRTHRLSEAEGKNVPRSTR